MRIALVTATFYEHLASRLTSGAESAAAEAGAEIVERFTVPGAFELPSVARLAAESGRFDAVVALGAVIRGETSHYDHVCQECARGLMDVSLQTGVPCGFGVLTVDSEEQALARSRPGRRDTGANAVHAVVAVHEAARHLQPAAV